MNPKSNLTKPQEMASRLQFARLQQTKAEYNLKNAKERARLAKRRRKEAKQAFRRARKDVKRAKVELAKTEELIIEIEAKLAAVTKVPPKKRPKAKKRARAQSTGAKPGRIAGKSASPPKGEVVKRKTPAWMTRAAKIAPVSELVPETDEREASLSMPAIN